MNTLLLPRPMTPSSSSNHHVVLSLPPSIGQQQEDPGPTISRPPSSASSPQHHPSSSNLDMEGVFYRLHSRLVHFVHRWTSLEVRSLMELFILVNAFALLVMLAWFHIRYVSRAETNCVTQVLRRELGMMSSSPPHVIKLQVSGIWSHLAEEAKSSEKLTKAAAPVVAANLFKVWLQDPVFVYSTERGFLMLDEQTRHEFKINEVAIKLRTETECFTDSPVSEMERYLLDNFIGYDTVVLNAFGAVFDSKGFLYSMHSRELMNVAHVHSASSSKPTFKLGAVATTLFLFFITTTLVHHTLRETQERMLKFTHDLQLYVRRGMGYRNLVLNHVVGSLVFVPIMVGMLFFLFEFFNDQLLAFMVLAVVWVCELFSVMSLRTYQTVRVFPRLFFLYFCSFHLYFFLFPSGFSYMALTCCVVFLQHSMLSFFIRYEMPALMTGRISPHRQRDVLSTQQQQHMDAPSVVVLPSTSYAIDASHQGQQVLHSTLTSRVNSSVTTASASTQGSPVPNFGFLTAAAPPSAGGLSSGRLTPKKKRSTIHTEPERSDLDNSDNVSTQSPPPPPPSAIISAHAMQKVSSSPTSMPPPMSVGPTRWLGEADNGNDLLLGLADDGASSQAGSTGGGAGGGWEIGGFS